MTRWQRGSAVPALLTALLLASSTHAQCIEDLSNNGVVDVADVLLVIGAWGKCTGECPEDVNEDGFVDVTDLLLVLAAWGPCLFEYPDYENEFAELVGIEFVGRDGPLTLAQDVYDRVDRDMGLIEEGWPQLVGGPHYGRWVPYHLLVGVDTKVPRDELDNMIAYFQAEVTAEWFGGAIILIEFPSGINVDAVIPIFEEVVPVEFAEADGYVQLPGATPGWFVEGVGQGAAEWTVVVPWTEGRICDPDSECCACWSRHTFLLLANGDLALLDVETGSYNIPSCEREDCSQYR